MTLNVNYGSTLLITPPSVLNMVTSGSKKKKKKKLQRPKGQVWAFEIVAHKPVGDVMVAIHLLLSHSLWSHHPGTASLITSHWFCVLTLCCSYNNNNNRYVDQSTGQEEDREYADRIASSSTFLSIRTGPKLNCIMQLHSSTIFMIKFSEFQKTLQWKTLGVSTR